jgi:hypothetical protein
MSTHIIPIGPATLDIIEVLNDGVRPEVESEETFFVYNGKGKPADIVTFDELGECSPEWMTAVKILFRAN